MLRRSISFRQECLIQRTNIGIKNLDFSFLNTWWNKMGKIKIVVIFQRAFRVEWTIEL